jgi:phage/plasmid-associated DNA primase
MHLTTESVFDILRPRIAHDALYNSRKREEEHASTCLAKTRSRILQIIRRWADEDERAVCWLHGPAGTGKSTIAHTIAEEYSRQGRLAATFFFSRKKGEREDINKLIPTLTYQFAATRRIGAGGGATSSGE